jgi:hypothetical protein
MANDREKAHSAWRSAERIKVLSDRLVGVGPFGIGLDGVLAWVPVASTVYSVGAGGLLMMQGAASGASLGTLTRMAAYIAVDSAASAIPVVSWTVDFLFPGHLLAAKALQKDIEARHGPSELPASWYRGAKVKRKTKKDGRIRV